MICNLLLFASVSALTTPGIVASEEDESVGVDEKAGRELFEKRIRPLLVKHCYECHSSAQAEPKGGLRLDTREAIRRGGESGPAVVPGNVEKSLLIPAIRRESLEMPPEKELSDRSIADFVQWIEMGAPDSRDHPLSAKQTAESAWSTVLEERRKWWSLQPAG